MTPKSRAFWQYVVEGKTAEEIAAEVGPKLVAYWINNELWKELKEEYDDPGCTKRSLLKEYFDDMDKRMAEYAKKLGVTEPTDGELPEIPKKKRRVKKSTGLTA